MPTPSSSFGSGSLRCAAAQAAAAAPRATTPHAAPHRIASPRRPRGELGARQRPLTMSDALPGAIPATSPARPAAGGVAGAAAAAPRPRRVRRRAPRAPSPARSGSRRRPASVDPAVARAASRAAAPAAAPAPPGATATTLRSFSACSALVEERLQQDDRRRTAGSRTTMPTSAVSGVFGFAGLSHCHLRRHLAPQAFSKRQRLASRGSRSGTSERPRRARNAAAARNRRAQRRPSSGQVHERAAPGCRARRRHDQPVEVDPVHDEHPDGRGTPAAAAGASAPRESSARNGSEEVAEQQEPGRPTPSRAAAGAANQRGLLGDVGVPDQHVLREARCRPRRR